MERVEGIFITLMVLILGATLFGIGGCYKVDTHEVGLETRWGKINSDSLSPGLYFVNPIGSKVVKYDAREIKSEITAETYTKDMQPADLQLVIVYAVDPAKIKEIHASYGRDWANKIIAPAVVGATKDVLGQWEADKIVNGREQAAKEINDLVGKMLEGKPVHFRQLIIANIDFSDAFEKAIEAKQIATQEAIKARNRTVQIEEESRQEVIKAEAKAKATIALAEADAKAMEVRGKALKENQDLIQLQFIEKWDGTAPQTLILGDSTAKPLVNLK